MGSSASGVRPRMQQLDFPFLETPFGEIRAPQRPVNVFELSGFPRWETVSSNVLAYFLDPRDQRHGLGTVFVDALLLRLEGAAVLGAEGRREGMMFQAADALASKAWRVETEASTYDRKRIDIYLTNSELSLAVIIENKLDAALYNPFASYVRRAAREFERVLSVVLAPSRRQISGIAEADWVSAALTYDDLFDSARALLSTAESPDPRSIDILNQFIENTSEKESRMDAATDADVVERFLDAISGQGQNFREFFGALERVNVILKRRAAVLFEQIRADLAQRGVLRHAWNTAGYDRRWGLQSGQVAVVYVAFELTSGNCIELMVGHDVHGGGHDLSVKAYPERRHPGLLYPDFNRLPLGPTLRSTDEEIVDAFLAEVDRLRNAHPRVAS